MKTARENRRQVTLLDGLLASLGDADATVRDLRVGLNGIAVLSRNLGLAHAPPLPRAPGVRDAGRLIGRSARGLAEYARSSNPI